MSADPIPLAVVDDLLNQYGHAATVRPLLELAYLRGHADALRAVREMGAKLAASKPHEWDAFCQVCGKRDSVRLSVKPAPDGFFKVICADCHARNEVRS